MYKNAHSRNPALENDQVTIWLLKKKLENVENTVTLRLNEESLAEIWKEWDSINQVFFHVRNKEKIAEYLEDLQLSPDDIIGNLRSQFFYMRNYQYDKLGTLIELYKKVGEQVESETLNELPGILTEGIPSEFLNRRYWDKETLSVVRKQLITLACLDQDPALLLRAAFNSNLKSYELSFTKDSISELVSKWIPTIGDDDKNQIVEDFLAKRTLVLKKDEAAENIAFALSDLKKKYGWRYEELVKTFYAMVEVEVYGENHSLNE